MAHTSIRGFGRQTRGNCWEFEAWATYSVTLYLKTKLRHPQDEYPSFGSLSLEDQKGCFGSDAFFSAVLGSWRLLL